MQEQKLGPSLNDTLHKEPCLTPLLLDVLLRFRFNFIGNKAGIERAYLQNSVAEYHCDFLGFLWFDDIFKDTHEITKY